MSAFFKVGAAMQARVRWIENSVFLGVSGSGHGVVMDGPPESGGQNLGFRPMEMLLVGMGGCTAYDVVQILRKGRHDIHDCEVELTAERAEEIPKVYTRIHLHFVIKGRNLSEDAVKRAIELSRDKYCSASIMLGKTAALSHDYEIREA